MKWWQIGHKGFHIILPLLLLCQFQRNLCILDRGGKYVEIFDERNESTAILNYGNPEDKHIY